MKLINIKNLKTIHVVPTDNATPRITAQSQFDDFFEYLEAFSGTENGLLQGYHPQWKFYLDSLFSVVRKLENNLYVCFCFQLLGDRECYLDIKAYQITHNNLPENYKLAHAFDLVDDFIEQIRAKAAQVPAHLFEDEIKAINLYQNYLFYLSQFQLPEDIFATCRPNKLGQTEYRLIPYITENYYYRYQQTIFFQLEKVNLLCQGMAYLAQELAQHYEAPSTNQPPSPKAAPNKQDETLIQLNRCAREAESLFYYVLVPCFRDFLKSLEKNPKVSYPLSQYFSYFINSIYYLRIFFENCRTLCHAGIFEEATGTSICDVEEAYFLDCEIRAYEYIIAQCKTSFGINISVDFRVFIEHLENKRQAVKDKSSGQANEDFELDNKRFILSDKTIELLFEIEDVLFDLSKQDNIIALYQDLHPKIKAVVNAPKNQSREFLLKEISKKWLILIKHYCQHFQTNYIGKGEPLAADQLKLLKDHKTDFEKLKYKSFMASLAWEKEVIKRCDTIITLSDLLSKKESTKQKSNKAKTDSNTPSSSIPSSSDTTLEVAKASESPEATFFKPATISELDTIQKIIINTGLELQRYQRPTHAEPLLVLTDLKDIDVSEIKHLDKQPWHVRLYRAHSLSKQYFDKLDCKKALEKLKAARFVVDTLVTLIVNVGILNYMDHNLDLSIEFLTEKTIVEGRATDSGPSRQTLPLNPPARAFHLQKINECLTALTLLENLSPYVDCIASNMEKLPSNEVELTKDLCTKTTTCTSMAENIITKLSKRGSLCKELALKSTAPAEIKEQRYSLYTNIRSKKNALGALTGTLQTVSNYQPAPTGSNKTIKSTC